MLAALLGLLVAGALSARVDLRLSGPDLEVIRAWKSQGGIGSFATRPGHLSKPGYLLLLHFALPEGGRSEREIRRWRLGQALFVWAGAAALALALRRRGRPAAAVAVAAMLLLCLPLRDACDWVMTEGAAIGLSLFFCAALVRSPSSRLFQAVLGLSAAAMTLLRPNLGYALVLVALAVLIGTRPAGLDRAAALGGGFAAGIALLMAVGSATKVPLASETSQALLFGSTEYGWPHDLVPWPSGPTPAETAREARERARQRWRDLWSQAPADRWRSLAWKAAHPILSSEGLPSLWDAGGYLVADKAVRNSWWLLVIAAAGAAVACLAGGSGPWRAVPSLVLALAVVQGAATGAVPRYFLPLVPLLCAGLVLSLATVRGAGAIAAGAATSVLLAAMLRIAPDAAESDFVTVRTPGARFTTRLPPGALPVGEVVTAHARILLSPGTGLGFDVAANGRTVSRHDPADASPSAAYQTFVLTGDLLRQARADGLEIEVRPTGAPSARFLYFPVVPPPLSPATVRDGATALPSAFGGTVRGGLPIWVHAGADPPRPAASGGGHAALEDPHVLDLDLDGVAW